MGIPRLGSPSDQTRQMDLEDIFFSRLKLMVVMGYAFLGDYPLGAHRRQAMLQNAQYMVNTAADLGSGTEKQDPPPDSGRQPQGAEYDHIFYQRVKLLAVMLIGVAKGFPMGEHRRLAMRENLDSIRRTLMFSMPSEEDFSMLKVA